MKQYSEAEALNKAAAYCTPCERCISEVSEKLATWGMTPAQQRTIIERLIDEKFIDETRYCRAFVGDKLRFNRWGRIKIAAKLKEKRLPSSEISEALAAIDEDEYISVLRTVIESKRRELRGADDYATNQKILRSAASRGFEPALIMRTIKFNSDEMDF